MLETDISLLPEPEDGVTGRITEAIRNAGSRGEGTWLVADGRRICAIVPPEAGEAFEQAVADVCGCIPRASVPPGGLDAE